MTQKSKSKMKLTKEGAFIPKENEAEIARIITQPVAMLRIGLAEDGAGLTAEIKQRGGLHALQGDDAVIVKRSLHRLHVDHLAADHAIAARGFGELAQMKFPQKNFIAMCRLCPFMKSITLKNVLNVLEKPSEEFEVNVSSDMAEKAKKSIDRMFELAE